MSMIINTGDDADELDEELEEREDDDRDDDDDDRPARRSKKDDDDSDEDDDEEQTPEELKAEVKRLRASLAKANSSGNRRRQQLKELRLAQKSLDAADDEDDTEDEDEEKPAQKKPAARGLDQRQVKRQVEKAVKARERELEQERIDDLVDMRTESALARAGFDEKAIKLLKREIDRDELDVDLKSRRIDGLDDEVDRLKAEYPGMVRRGKSARRRVNGGDDRDGTRKARPKTASEIQAEAIRGH